MKSCWINVVSGGTTLEFRDIPVPQPKPGEIVVRVHAAALNRGEVIADIGLLKSGEPKPFGIDTAGEVHAIGEGVTGWKAGDRVMGRGRGAFSEYAVLPAHQAIPIPANLSWEQAASIPLVFSTAYELIFPYGKLEKGQTLLVVGASSGAGVACVQIAKHVIGATVIGTSGSKDKLAKLKTLGLDVGVETRGANFAAKVKEATGGKGANLAINMVGGSVFAECMRALANQGRLGVVGYVDGVVKSEIDLELLHANRLQVFSVSNKNVTQAQRAEVTRNFTRDVVPAFADGRIVPAIDKVYEFDRLPAAKSHMESNTQVGKIVVRVA